MSYSAFGPWKSAALRLIYDDVPLSRQFFKKPGCTLISPYSLSLADAAFRAKACLDRQEQVVIPCMTLLIVKEPQITVMTHAVLLICDGTRVRLFDPNGAYPSLIRYFLRGHALTSSQVMPFLRNLCGSDAVWSISKSGVQSTIREHAKTRYVPKRGYCMFLCKTLIDLLALHSQRNKGGTVGSRETVRASAM